jgi:hypothetical protein
MALADIKNWNVQIEKEITQKWKEANFLNLISL